jgi:hypothetical protein
MKSQREHAALEGELQVEGELIKRYTPAEAFFSFNNLDTGKRGIKPRTEYNKGKFDIYELPAGNYNIFISINSNEDNPGGYPGYPGDFFKLMKNVSVGGESREKLEVDMERIIHLRRPADNGEVMELWGEKGDKRITFNSPVVFAWEDLGDGAEYHYFIKRMSEPYKFIEYLYQKETTRQTSLSIDLPVSLENEYYIFHVYATKDGSRIAELKTHGEHGYGSDLRFRVK